MVLAAPQDTPVKTNVPKKRKTKKDEPDTSSANVKTEPEEKGFLEEFVDDMVS